MALRFSVLPGHDWNSKLSSTWTERRRLAGSEGAWPAVVSLAGPMGSASSPALPAGMQSAALSDYTVCMAHAAFSALAMLRFT